MTNTYTVTQEETPSPKATKSSKSLAKLGAPVTTPIMQHPPHNGKTITMEEVKKNNGGYNKTYTVIHGRVYDLTPFLSSHPGGNVIRLAAGRDSTCLIESYHPSTSTKRIEAALANKCTYLGQLSPDVPSYDDSFFQTVRARCEQTLRDNNIGRHYYEAITIGESILTAILYLVATYMVAFHGSYLWAAALGILTGRMGFLMHTGNHMGTSKYVFFNRLAGYFMDLIGSSYVIWYHEHQVAHHMDPNELGKDNDCQIGDPIIRMHPGLPIKWYHKFQHITVLVGMTGGFAKWYLSDLPYLLKQSVGHVSFSVTMRDTVQVVFFKAMWFLMHVAAPWYNFGGWYTFMSCVVFMGIGAHYLENIFIVNHIQSHLIPPNDAHWSVKQVLGTANWASGSPFWNFFSGGLNHQIEHHLFPSMSTYLYPLISPVVRQTCEEFGLPYSNYPSFGTAWLDMVNNLRALGRGDDLVAQKKVE